MMDDPDAFWSEVVVLTNKFEPLSNFAREEAYFELKLSTKVSRMNALENVLRQENID